MNDKIMNEFMHFLQNSADGKKITDHSELPPDELKQVAEAIIPKMTDQMQNSSQSLSDLFAIISHNKENPNSLLNAQPGFDTQKAQAEGHQILQSLFGQSVQTDQLATEISQKTGLSASQISAALPMLATFATKVLSGGMETKANGEQSGFANSFMQQIVGLLDSNQDGSVVDDLANMGKQLLGKFLNKSD